MRTVAVMFILIATYAAGHDLRGLRVEVVPGTPTACLASGCTATTRVVK